MARGVASPAPASLPRVLFVKVVGENSTRAGVHDNQQRSYGYNDFSLFERPQHYVRYIEPLETELAVQVEYDMDEQDQEWLDALNAERRKEQLDKISYEAFEIVMDRLEKEWFDLTKNISKPDLALPSEDSTCSICDDSEGENTNAIVFCDGCNLAVHQDCYGVPYIPEGQWLCRKCTVSPENPVSCFLCPNEGGAFKQTVHGEWVHLLCAIWIPETRVANEVFMEPINGVERISKQRWKLKCSVCDIREGACIQCSKNSCFLAYHVTCARREKLLMPMKASSGLEPPPLQCFCERHIPRERLEARAEALKAEAALQHSEAKSSKSARAYAKTYKPGPPVVPLLILSRILQYINKIVIRKRSEFVELVCRYWSLKREVRRGAPLLKRLHLEPWTASASCRIQTDEEKVTKLELTKRLRKDLADVRILAELSRKRESRKLGQAQIVQEVLSQVVFAHEARLRMTFENIVAFDRQGFFKNRISRSQVPDYFDVIEQPMWWGVIDEKLDRHEYWDIETFKADITLVIENAMRYNKFGTPYYKAAQRIKSHLATVLADLNNLRTSAPSELVAQNELMAICPAQRSISDLEPPLALLNLLISPGIADGLNVALHSDPLQCLLAYELPEVKLPPTLPTRPNPPPRKTKRERRANVAKRLVDTSYGSGAFLPTSFPANSAAAVDKDPAATATPTTAMVVSPELEDESETEQVLGKRKRAKPAPSHPGTDAEVLTDINPKASFALFDKGWILDPGVRRGGRARIDRPPPPLTKKRSKVTINDQITETTRLEQVASFDELPFGTKDQSADEQGDNYSQNNQPNTDINNRASRPYSVHDQLVNSLTLAEAKLKFKLEPNMTLSQDPDGKLVIQELDSPITRREKAMRKKRARSKLAAPIVTASSALDGSDLSSLSELSEDDDGIVPVRKKTDVKFKTTQPGQVILEDGEMLEGGTLVWAKASVFCSLRLRSSHLLIPESLENFPWWAAVIFEPDDPTVPPKVLKSRPTKSRSPMGHHLVRFYDSSKSWQWVELDQLLLLGENDALDQLLLTASKRQKFSSAKMRQGCRESYR
ncbi:PHD-zinc-finger like domain-containing protein [Russula earlei]|uniref:PHD-zinc-finger like domain-containing protein n=2 Tax=Russula earlei TaxID=71964 RepID=A0ACC0UN53_9AGAM|nr:PHD-zinc-finger like domain-containing protein [Russula earlei]